MFDSERNVVIFSTVLAFVIIGSIVEGYILHDQVTMTTENWRGVIIGRFFFHLIGTLPLWLLVGHLTESYWKPVLLGGVVLTLMNVNPVLDLIYGPNVLNEPEIEHWVREEYNHPSSDVDFSTHEVPMIRLVDGERSVMLTERRWEEVISTCDGQTPVRFVGLEHLEVELEWTCP